MTRRRKPCTNRDGTPKKRWATLAAAEYVADWERMKGHDKYAYECPACGKWHTATNRGSPSRRKRRANRRQIRGE